MRDKTSIAVVKSAISIVATRRERYPPMVSATDLGSSPQSDARFLGLIIAARTSWIRPSILLKGGHTPWCQQANPSCGLPAQILSRFWRNSALQTGATAGFRSRLPENAYRKCACRRCLMRRCPAGGERYSLRRPTGVAASQSFLCISLKTLFRYSALLLPEWFHQLNQPLSNVAAPPCDKWRRRR